MWANSRPTPDVDPVTMKTLPLWSGRFFSVREGATGRIVDQSAPIARGLDAS